MRRPISFLPAGLPLSLALVTGCSAEAPPPRTPPPLPAPSVEAPPPPPARSYTINGRALRVDPGGVLRELDAVPKATPEHSRPRDPAWHGTEAPLLAVVRRGARLDDGTVIVAAAGDVARVDLRTGSVKIVAAGGTRRRRPSRPSRLRR